MTDLPDQSVHLVVTSPPYWQVKDYGNKAQVGFHDSYEDFINNLNLVWSECFRVLHNGCRLCINVGDQFARSVYYGRYKVIPIRTEIIRFCETIGMDYMGAVIWRKVTTTNTTGGATVMGSFPYPRNGILKLDYEFILIFRKQGIAPKPEPGARAKSKLTTKEWNTYFSGHWHFPGERQNRHLAMFPEELPRRLIRMFSFSGDRVLDPFLGSGTTSLAAMHLQRNSIGYEIGARFMPIIREKLHPAAGKNGEKATLEFVTQKPDNDGYREKIDRLPYRFVDPHKLDKQVDPRTIRFGSKNDPPLRVTEVVSGELLLLSDRKIVRLLGVAVSPARAQQAVDFLKKKAKGKRIFLRFESEQLDDTGNLLAYVYLSNRTFLNAHLIKAGFADTDSTRTFRFKKRFLAYQSGRRPAERSESVLPSSH